MPSFRGWRRRRSEAGVVRENDWIYLWFRPLRFSVSVRFNSAPEDVTLRSQVSISSDHLIGCDLGNFLSVGVGAKSHSRSGGRRYLQERPDNKIDRDIDTYDPLRDGSKVSRKFYFNNSMRLLYGKRRINSLVPRTHPRSPDLLPYQIRAAIWKGIIRWGRTSLRDTWVRSDSCTVDEVQSHVASETHFRKT